MTGAHGRASARWILGPEEGEQDAQASAVGPGGDAVSGVPEWVATANRGPRMMLFSGNHQIGSDGDQLAEPLVVYVYDDRSQPVAGEAASWVLDDAGGNLSATEIVTDELGIARTRWTRGTSDPAYVEAMMEWRGEPIDGSPVRFRSGSLDPEFFSGIWRHQSAQAFADPQPAPEPSQCFEYLIRELSGHTWYFRHYPDHHKEYDLRSDGSAVMSGVHQCGETTYGPYEGTWRLESNRLVTDTW